VTADNQILVGVVARLSPQKDPLLLLNALKRLPDKILSRLRIVWIGSSRDNNLRTTVTDKIRHLDLSNSFFLLPEMRQIRIAYQSIDALVLPSRWEGFPNAVLEALAEGKPVIATEVGDVRAMVENGKSGWVVPPADPEALAGAIEEMVKIGHNSRKKMGKSGCDKVRKLYSSERLAEQTLAVYDKILV
jgi:glycosyltransferase involved in cell wall biosynthesis